MHTALAALWMFQQEATTGGEASLKLPDLSTVNFLNVNGHSLLLIGLIFCAFGLLFGLGIYLQLKNLAVHRSMKDISELIYETCKTYLITQGKFLALLWVFIAAIISLYFGVLAPIPGHPVAQTLLMILAFSVVGILGSYGVAWFGIRVNTFANSRTAFAGLRDYVRGDDVRRVSWSATARRDRPVVVEVEAERGQQVMIALDCGRLMTAPAGDLDKLDHAVNAALMLAWVAQAFGDRVGMMTFDDRVTGFIKPERGAAQLRRITEALYSVKSEYVEPDFGHAMTHLALRVGRRSMVVLLTDVQDPEASRELVAHALRLAARHLVLVVAMSDPSVLSARDGPINSTNRAYEWAAAEEFVSSRRESFELLRRGGVLGLDVVAGKLSPSLVERYLELKERALL